MRRYVLRSRWGLTLITLLFFGACAVVLGYLAYAGTTGIVLYEIIDIGPGTARFVFAALALFSGGLVVGVLSMSIKLTGGRHAIELDEKMIIVPGALFRPAKLIWLRDIQSARLEIVEEYQFLILEHGGGKARIQKEALSEGAFEEIVAFLQQRLAARSTGT